MKINIRRRIPVPVENGKHAIERHRIILPVIDIAKRTHKNFNLTVIIAKIDMFRRSFFVVHSQINPNAVRYVRDKLRKNHIRKNRKRISTGIIGFRILKRHAFPICHIRYLTALIIRIDNLAFALRLVFQSFENGKRRKLDPFQ